MKIKIGKKFIVYLLVLVIGIGVGTGGMILKERFLPSNSAGVTTVNNNTSEVGPFIELSEFTINLDGGGIVRTEITIEGVNKKSKEKITEKEIFLRDRVIAVIGSKDLEGIRTAESREELKKELVTELNKECGDQIKDVLFKSFIYSP